MFEWYDFYLYATLAPFFATLFFPKTNATAALLGSFVSYAAGFLVRPFGALVFGRIGDLVGRKYTFLVTILVMGLSTAAVGVLPTYATVGFLSPILLMLLRLAQGLALGGEYGGAATYVAEHAPDSKRGLHTSWIQTTATIGFFVSLVVIGVCRANMAEKPFNEWGWRIPFLLSLVLLGISVYIRLKLNESPVFLKMKSEGKGSKQPIRDSFGNWPNAKIVLIALFGAAAGQGVVWYSHKHIKDKRSQAITKRGLTGSQPTQFGNSAYPHCKICPPWIGINSGYQSKPPDRYRPVGDF